MSTGDFTDHEKPCPHITTRAFQQAGPLTQGLFATDLSFSGVCEPPTAKEMAMHLCPTVPGKAKNLTGSVKALHAIGMVTINTKQDEWVRGFEEMYDYVTRTLSQQFKDRFAWDVATFEHSLCKWIRSKAWEKRRVEWMKAHGIALPEKGGVGKGSGRQKKKPQNPKGSRKTAAAVAESDADSESEHDTVVRKRKRGRGAQYSDDDDFHVGRPSKKPAAGVRRNAPRSARVQELPLESEEED